MASGMQEAAAGMTADVAVDDGDRDGLYGPASEAWRLNREAAMLLVGGPRALLQWNPVMRTGVQSFDEMLNNDDQAGGHVANAQNFGNNRYQDGTGWHNMNRPLGGNCDANSYPAHWHCHTSTSVPNYFVSWDDRVP